MPVSQNLLFQEIEIQILILKQFQRETTISGIDDKIISLYARGMSIRDIEKQIKEIYDVDISDSLISRITDKIVPEIKDWQNRTLEPIYPIVYMDAWAALSAYFEYSEPIGSNIYNKYR